MTELNCTDPFQVYNKVIQLYVCVYIYIYIYISVCVCVYILFQVLFMTGYDRTLNIVPCAI